MDREAKPPGRDIEYTVDYRDIKYPRLEFKTGKLLLVLPRNHEKESALLEKHQEWLQRKGLAIETALRESIHRQLNLDRTDEELKSSVLAIANRIREELGFDINQIVLRRMRSKWASCSSRGNLTLNKFLKYLPDRLVEYVVFHEMEHTRERRHNKRFWNAVGKRFPDYQRMEHDLLVFWFLVQRRELSDKPQQLG